MALLNNIYIFVEDESITYDIESTSHAVEKGVEITDHIQKKAIQISLKGKIVDYEGVKSYDALSKILQLKNSGSLINYVGRSAMGNMQIQSFSTTHPYTNWGGCDFNMTLKEVRIAKPAYTAPETKQNNGGTQQVEKGENKEIYHKVKKGDNIWNLVTKTYKSLDPKHSKTMSKCNWVMSKNQSAFSRKGDFRTLQIGEKILIGYRK